MRDGLLFLQQLILHRFNILISLLPRFENLILQQLYLRIKRNSLQFMALWHTFALFFLLITVMFMFFFVFFEFSLEDFGGFFRIDYLLSVVPIFFQHGGVHAFHVGSSDLELDFLLFVFLEVSLFLWFFVFLFGGQFSETRLRFILPLMTQRWSKRNAIRTTNFRIPRMNFINPRPTVMHYRIYLLDRITPTSKRLCQDRIKVQRRIHPFVDRRHYDFLLIGLVYFRALVTPAGGLGSFYWKHFIINII